MDYPWSPFTDEIGVQNICEYIKGKGREFELTKLWKDTPGPEHLGKLQILQQIAGSGNALVSTPAGQEVTLFSVRVH